MIYFLLAKTTEGSRIKVGFTENFSQRLSAIERVNACRIEVLGTMPGTEEQEQEMLKDIEEYRDHHEWFYDTPELREWIARQRYPEGLP
jgi:T5orf172 domain